jgi:hypothetical protein
MRVKSVSMATLALGLAFSTLAAAQTKGDANRTNAAGRLAADIQARKVFDQVRSSKVGIAAPGDACALAIIPGPATGFNIRVGIFNLLGENAAFSTVDPFGALGGASLINESVFSTTAPAGGTLTVEYAVAAGKGPSVLSFTDFGVVESASFNLDPDTYDDPAFGATVGDMSGTVIELAYDGGRRCRGVFAFNVFLNASLAVLTQSSPTP